MDNMLTPDSTFGRGTGFSRRGFLAASVAGAAFGAFKPGLLAAAALPYTFKHGEFEITIISDGHLVLPTQLLAPDAPRDARSVVLSESGVAGEDYEPAMNVTLVRRGADLILFDTGGVGFQGTAGMLSDNLAAVGIDPASITKVVFTHGHPDHLWGTVLASGALRFPNAAYYSGSDEWEFWTGKDVLTKLPKAQHPFATGAQRNYLAVKNTVTLVRPGEDIVSGIRVLDTAGHTPGHISFELEGGEGLIIVGDAIVAPRVFFPHPEWKFGFDSDPDLAITTRRKLLDRAASERTALIGYHWGYPGLGYAERRGTGYRLVPVA